MSQPQTRAFHCEVYRTDEIDAYPRNAEAYIGTTVSFLVYGDHNVRKLSTGEDAALHDHVDTSEPVRTDVLELIKYDNTFYTTDPTVEEVNIGTHYLVDGEVVITPTSKTNRVEEQGPIEAITEDDFMPDHEDYYVINRQNPFGRFRYRTNRVRRFIKSDRVAKLSHVADG